MPVLRSRWNALLFVVVILAPLFGCMLLDASPHSSKSSGLDAAKPTMNFGTVVLGDYTEVNNTLANSSNVNITISQATVTGTGFEITGPTFPLTLAPGQQATLSATFTPTAAGQATGAIVLANNGPNPAVTLNLSATAVTPGTLAASPSSISFGNVMVGKTQSAVETFSNSGGTNITITQATASQSAFQVSGLNLPLTLKPGQSITFNIAFAPTTGGAASGGIVMAARSAGWAHNRRGTYHRASLTLGAGFQSQASGAADDGLTIPVTGMAVTPSQLIATASINFSSTPIGKSQGLPDTLTNTGGTSVTVSQVTPTGPGFSITGLSLPFTIAAGQSTSFTVVFSPQSAGSASGNIAISSNASNATVNTALAGTSVASGSLTASPSSVSFGSVQTGKSQAASETLTNSGGSSVTITQAAATGSGFSVSGISLPLTLAAGQSTSFSVAFAPQAGGAATGSLGVVSNASNSTLAVGLSGTGVTAGSLTASPSTVSFGSVQTGKTQTASETLTNFGGSSVTITQATATGAGFSMSGMTMPLTLGAGQSASFTVAFAPQASGAVTGGLAITSNASNASLAVGLSGTGVTAGSLTPGPSSVSFGNVQTGKNQTASETLTNSGGSSVTITGATATGSGFSLSGISLPLTLAAGQSSSFTVAFAPQASGAVTGGVSITSNASNSTLNIGLSGSGVAAGTLAAAGAGVSFGSVQVNGSLAVSDTITNTGGSSVTITGATATGSGFSLSGITLPLTLAAGQSSSFTVAFTPLASGAVTGGVSITSNASNATLAVALSGTGVSAGSLSPSPSSVSFGNVQSGKNQTASETLTNSGGSSVTITGATATGSGFSLSGISLPLTLAAGQSSSFTVAFAPQASGAVTGGLAITSNASNASLAVGLSGTGVTAGSLTPGPSSVSFGNVQTGKNQTASETLTNSGGSSVTITGATATGSGFSLSGISLPLTLAAGQSSSFTVAFTPQSSGAVTGGVSITSNASNSTLNIGLSGSGVTAGTLAATQSSVSFGSVQVNGSSAVSDTITNAGGSSVTLTQVNVTGGGFSAPGLTLPLTLNAGQSFTFSAMFAPQSAGAVTGSISVISNASNATLAISLSGTGTAAGQLTASPTTLSFGSSTVGVGKSLTGSLSATGASVTISSGSSSTSEFSLSGISFPVTIAAGQSAPFTMTFTPQASGIASATATFMSNAANTAAVQSLTGTGVAPVQHQVTLSWDSSTSSVMGYNVYRGTAAGGPYTKINSTTNAGTVYTDSAVVTGQTYYYLTTAVSSEGMESTYSNQVAATIPTP